MAERKGLAIAALGLGIFGLCTAGGLCLGSLLGLGLAIAVLTGPSRAGRDLAWAALALNVLALVSILPAGAAIWAYSRSPETFLGQVEAPPGPAPSTRGVWTEPSEGPTTPPPPPPSPRVRHTDAGTTAENARPPRQAGTSPVRVGGAIREPRKTRHVNPVYPQIAAAARVQGVVILECTISPQGKVVAIKKLRGVPLLDEAAVEAVGQWEYAPTLLEGVPVTVIMTVTVNFKLS